MIRHVPNAFISSIDKTHKISSPLRLVRLAQPLAGELGPCYFT